MAGVPIHLPVGTRAGRSAEVVRAALALPRQAWEGADRPRRLAFAVGTLLIASGLLHLVVWAVAGGPAAGPVSWRKPVTFGTSFGLTAVTLAYLGGHLRIGRRTSWWVFGGAAYATAVEVGWVTLQRWRGVPSHFNFATPLDTWLFYVMGAGSIVVLIAVIATITVLSFRRAATTASTALAMRVGLVVLLVAQGVGYGMISRGFAAVGTDVTPWAAVVALKTAHFAPMHAVQVLPAVAWALSLARVREGLRLRLVGLAAVGYVVLVVAVIAQAFAGLPLAVAAGLSAVGLVLLLGAVVATARALLVPVHGTAGS